MQVHPCLWPKPLMGDVFNFSGLQLLLPAVIFQAHLRLWLSRSMSSLFSGPRAGHTSPSLTRVEQRSRIPRSAAAHTMNMKPGHRGFHVHSRGWGMSNFLPINTPSPPWDCFKSPHHPACILHIWGCTSPVAAGSACLLCSGDTGELC